MITETKARFNAFVRQSPNGCWLWCGCVLQSGYGQFRLGDTLLRAHRAAWLLFVGELLPSQQVLHTCDVRNCVNPAHLYVGSIQENMRDRDSRGRQARGVCQHKAIIDEAAVRAFRQLYVDGYSTSQIGAQFGVSRRIVYDVIRKRTWKHVL